jgi:CBS domain-containing membrane protein
MVRKLAYSVSEREHWISASGGLLGILTALWVSHVWLGGHDGILLVSSMGSAALLLFAAPHGAMSQPWPLFGGNLVSAVIGVFCVRWLGNEPMLAASLAVSLSIAAMYGLRCLHPPGGATALSVVLGGETVHAMGYGFVLMPVLLNVVVMFTVAVLFNYPFAWRRYPQSWVCKTQAVAETAKESMIPHSNLVYALSQIDTFVDVSEEDLQRIYALALAGPPLADLAARRDPVSARP